MNRAIHHEASGKDGAVRDAGDISRKLDRIAQAKERLEARAIHSKTKQLKSREKRLRICGVEVALIHIAAGIERSTPG